MERPRFNYLELQMQYMSLSGVTERFGEPGLTKRLEMEITSLSEDERDFCMRALELASHLHRNDEYKNRAYITHPLRTAIRLVRDYDQYDKVMIAGGLLHDSVEDHPRDLVRYFGGEAPLVTQDARQAALGTLAVEFSPDLSQLVASVTNEITPQGLSAQERRERYQLMVTEKIATSYQTFLLKLSDFTENGIGLLWTDVPERLPHFTAKYYPLFDVFLWQLEQYAAQGVMPEKHAHFARQQLSAGKARCLRIQQEL